LFILYFNLTNPFNKINIVDSIYDVIEINEDLQLIQTRNLKLINNPLIKCLAWIKSGYHIFVNVYFGGEKSIYSDVNLIKKDIYADRFSPKFPYLISGDHFNSFYPRNLGTFYISALDPRVDTDEKIWKDRQKILLKSTALAIEVFSQNKKPCTTIVPLGLNYYTCISIYAYPSDSIYALLFSLKAMLNSDDFKFLYPYEKKELNLSTKKAAKNLIENNKTNLKKLIDGYYEYVYDKKTGLIKKNIYLSGMKDITKRQGAFYDNVILWRTLELADDLRIKKISKKELDSYKKRIIKTYWYDKGGYFLEDLSKNSLKNKYYSSDWLVIMFTGFLKPTIKDERVYYEKSFNYINKNGLNRPFGLPYHKEERSYRQHFVVRLFLNQYGSSSIWSFWGIEYAKALLITGYTSNNHSYINEARFQLDAYKKNIEKYKGFPEVYNKNGKLLKNFFYKSVWKTGWIINYDQAENIYKFVVKK
jgi:hypothetical protein